MSLQPEPLFDVPELTAQVAQAAFPKGNIYLQLRDELGSIYKDELFSELYAHDGQPAISPWRLALVTVVQFAENLPDRQAADAVRSRIDLKYLLGLELTDPGFDYQVKAKLTSQNRCHQAYRKSGSEAKYIAASNHQRMAGNCRDNHL